MSSQIPTNTSFTVTDSTGRILRAGSCPTSLLASQAMKPGEVVYAFRGDPRTQRVENGQLVPISAP